MRDNVMRVVAHDPFPVDSSGNPLPLPANFVMGIGGATTTLLDLTPSTHVGRALDLGCGSAVQTMFLNADRIIATDIDERALAAANHTCFLSGMRNLEPNVWRNGDAVIEFRQGSLLEPVQGQRFDLIVSNPPFVIAGAGHTHRDSPYEGDGMTRELLVNLPEHLNVGGKAILLTSWLHMQGEDWSSRIRAWQPAGASMWVAQRQVLDLQMYVDVWGDDAALAQDDRDAWITRLEQLGCEGIGFGWIVLERSANPWCEIEDVTDAARIPNGAELERQLEAFAAEFSAIEMLFEPLAFNETHWRGDLVLDPFIAAVLTQVRGGSTVSEAIDHVAVTLPVDADDLLAVTLQWARIALRQGYLTPALPEP